MYILGGSLSKKPPKWRLWEYFPQPPIPPPQTNFIFFFFWGGGGGILKLKNFDCALIKTAKLKFHKYSFCQQLRKIDK